MEARGLIRKLAGGQVGKLPELGPAEVRVSLPGGVIAAVNRRQTLATTEIFHELRGQVGGHSSFRSRSLLNRQFLRKKNGRRIRKAREASTNVTSDRLVIDPKCDTCTKRRAWRAYKKEFEHIKCTSKPLSPCAPQKVCSQINAAKMNGRQSCNVFVSVMLPS
jgi:hypothetical protein